MAALIVRQPPLPRYHRRPANLYRVVGVSVWPKRWVPSRGVRECKCSSLELRVTLILCYSVDSHKSDKPVCDSTAPLVLKETGENKIFYTYSIQWVESDVRVFH